MLCRRINDEAGSSHPPILAVAHSDVEARVELLEAGADDVLARPIDPRELEALVEALLLRRDPASRAPRQTSRPRRPPRAARAGHRIRLSQGRIGHHHARRQHRDRPGRDGARNVAIADIDMYHGQVSTHLDIYARTSTAALAREEATASIPRCSTSPVASTAAA